MPISAKEIIIALAKIPTAVFVSSIRVDDDYDLGNSVTRVFAVRAALENFINVDFNVVYKLDVKIDLQVVFG